MMKSNILQSKSQAFAVRTIKFYKHLCSKNEFVLGKQILKSGTSIGANIRESRNAQSPSDFISKMNIALKEADETQYWLEIMHDAGIINRTEYEALNNDIKELIALLTSSIKTLKKNLH